MKTGKEMYIQENSIVSTAKEPGILSITHLLYNAASNNFVVVTVDHNIIIHSLKTFDYVKQVNLFFRTMKFIFEQIILCNKYNFLML